MIKKILIAVLLLAGIASAGELKFLSPLTVDSFRCRTQAWDRTWHILPNPVGRDIYIRKVQLGMGVDAGGMGDIWTFVTRSTDGYVIAGYNWERYDRPTGLHEHVQNFGPHYFKLAADAGLRINYGCMGLTAAQTKNGYVRVWIWYTDEP